MNKTLWSGGVLAVLLAAAGLAWAYLPAGEDPQVAKVQELQAKAFAPQAETTPEERRQAFQELRTEAEKLPPEKMGEMIRKNPPPFMREMQETIRKFSALPEDERKPFLDQQIDKMEVRRKEMAKMFPDGPPGPPPNASPERRQEMQKQFLNNVSAQDRAAISTFMREMSQRRKERGMTPLPTPF